MQRAPGQEQCRGEQQHDDGAVGLGRGVGDNQCSRDSADGDSPVTADQGLPQYESDHRRDSKQSDCVRLEHFPAVHTQQVADPSTEPEPTGGVERWDVGVRHVAQRRRIRQPRQVFGPKLLVDGDAEQVQLGCRQGHSEGHGNEAGQPDPRCDSSDPRPLTDSVQVDRRREQSRGYHLAQSCQSASDVGRVERRPLNQ